MTIVLSNLSGSARFDPRQPVLAHAADELRRHVGLAGGLPGAVDVELTTANATSDGFTAAVSGGGVTIAGDSPRGALNGLYWLLERLGILWVRPGEDGTRFVPGRTLADGSYRHVPSFARRTLILGNDALHDEWRDWMEFASRNRLNSVFFHDTPPSLLSRNGAPRPSAADGIAQDGKGWMFERWDSDGPAIIAEAELRGIAVQFGGHHLPALLRRELFEAHPDWFPMRNGRRDARYNLCSSSKGTLEEVRARAREFFRRFSGARVYHLWADDILGGGWCSCALCSSLSASDQALRATNRVAEALAEVDPSAKVAHLAYHDTIAPPTGTTPATNVTALYAPRNRNYAFAIDDPSCPRNAQGHYRELLSLGETFAGHSGALAAFEYYSDAILYKCLAPPNLAVLPADARAYAAAGVHDYGDLAVTPRPWCGPAWHAWWFARCAWDTGVSAEDELARFCEASFGDDASAFTGLFRSFDEGYRLILDLGDLERIPRHDVLDFSDTPREALRTKAGQLQQAIETMNGAVRGLPLSPVGLGRDYREDLAVQLAAANHLAERTLAWDAALDGRRDDAAGHLSLSRLHLRALTDWDRTHTGPAYANLSRNMLRAAEWHTARVAGLLE